LRWSESSALIVVGKNTLNPHLFERCAAYSIRRFLADGWSIAIHQTANTALLIRGLRPRRQRPRRCAAEQGDELPPPHGSPRGWC
jgi:hypothetical protein